MPIQACSRTNHNARHEQPAYPTRPGLGYPRVIAHTLILVGLGWNGSGAVVLGFNGEIHWEWLPALIAGSLIGGYIGAHLSLVKGSGLVKRAFEALSLLMGASLLIRAVSPV